LKLHCEHLEPVTPTVGLDVVPLLGVESHPLFGEVVAAMVRMAERVDAQDPLPAITQPYTAFHGWGVDVGRPLPPDTLRVYVGPLTGPEYGLAAPGGWQSETPLSRNWGGWVGLNLDRISGQGADAATVARHELGHVFGLPHSTTGLMRPTLPAGVARDLTAGDADALESLGWDARPITAFPERPYVRVFPAHLDGWAYMTVDDAEVAYPDYVRRDDPGGDSWALFPR